MYQRKRSGGGNEFFSNGSSMGCINGGIPAGQGEAEHWSSPGGGGEGGGHSDTRTGSEGTLSIDPADRRG